MYGPAVDQILADESVASLTSPGAVLWPLADHLGTPRDLAEYNAAASETAVASHRVYDSFGNLVSESNGAIEHLFGFTGVLYEATTGLNYHRARWLDLSTGRWMGEDPIGFAAGDTNLTRYVHNSPTNHTDPTGLQEPGFDADNPYAFPRRPPPPKVIPGSRNDMPDVLPGKWRVTLCIEPGRGGVG